MGNFIEKNCRLTSHPPLLSLKPFTLPRHLVLWTAWWFSPTKNGSIWLTNSFIGINRLLYTYCIESLFAFYLPSGSLKLSRNDKYSTCKKLLELSILYQLKIVVIMFQYRWYVSFGLFLYLMTNSRHT